MAITKTVKALGTADETYRQEPPPHRPTRLRQDDRHPPPDRAVGRPSPGRLLHQGTAGTWAASRLRSGWPVGIEGNSGSCRLQVETSVTKSGVEPNGCVAPAPNRIAATCDAWIVDEIGKIGTLSPAFVEAVNGSGRYIAGLGHRCRERPRFDSCGEEQAGCSADSRSK